MKREQTPRFNETVAADNTPTNSNFDEHETTNMS